MKKLSLLFVSIINTSFGMESNNSVVPFIPPKSDMKVPGGEALAKCASGAMQELALRKQASNTTNEATSQELALMKINTITEVVSTEDFETYRQEFLAKQYETIKSLNELASKAEKLKDAPVLIEQIKTAQESAKTIVKTLEDRVGYLEGFVKTLDEKLSHASQTSQGSQAVSEIVEAKNLIKIIEKLVQDRNTSQRVALLLTPYRVSNNAYSVKLDPDSAIKELSQLFAYKIAKIVATQYPEAKIEKTRY
jgi:hypothetical protein